MMWTWRDTVESDSAFSPTLPLFWDGKVSSLKKLPFYLTEFGALPLSFRSTQARKPTPSVSPTDVGESQNVKLPSGHTLDGLASSFCLGA